MGSNVAVYPICDLTTVVVYPICDITTVAVYPICDVTTVAVYPYILSVTSQDGKSFPFKEEIS